MLSLPQKRKNKGMTKKIIMLTSRYVSTLVWLHNQIGNFV